MCIKINIYKFLIKSHSEIKYEKLLFVYYTLLYLVNTGGFTRIFNKNKQGVFRMKRSIPLAIMVAAVLVASNQSFAYHLTGVVNDANNLRASAWHLNDHATAVENDIKHLQSHGINPVHLKADAKNLRHNATHLAIESNIVAKEAFDLGYHRPNHSH